MLALRQRRLFRSPTRARAALLAARLADYSVGADVLGSREPNAWRPALAVIQIPQHAHTLGGDLHAFCALLLGESQTFLELSIPCVMEDKNCARLLFACDRSEVVIRMITFPVSGK